MFNIPHIEVESSYGIREVVLSTRHLMNRNIIIQIIKIIGNCDSYLYFGCNDVETATKISKRANVPLAKILYMPVGTNWLFRREQLPINGRNLRLERYIEQMKI